MATVAAIQRRRTIHHAIEAQSVSHGSNWSSSLSLSPSVPFSSKIPRSRKKRTHRVSVRSWPGVRHNRSVSRNKFVSKRFVLAGRRGGMGSLYVGQCSLCSSFSVLRGALRLRLLFPGQDELPDWLPFSVRDRRGASFLVKKVAISPGSDVKWKIDRGKLGWREFARTFSINFVNICGPLNENIS